jgi:D-glycero-beta-D-manno-heptose-7-phosphate kinase
MYRKKLARFYKIISRMPKARVLVVGDIMLDRFIWGTVSRISPEAPVPVVWAKSESFMPGGASNVANNICALGADAYICGVIGDDEAGRILVSEIAKNGIKTDGIVLDKNRPTIHKTRIIAHNQQVVRIDKESDNALDKHLIDSMLSYAKTMISDTDAIIIEDYGKGLVSPRLIKELIAMAKRYKKIITVDPKEEHFSLYSGVTSITPNSKEAEDASGIKIKDNITLQKSGGKILKMLKSDSVLITLGEDGMALFRKGKACVRIPTVAQEVYDVSGAGDTVIGVFTLALACGAGSDEAAYIANAAAGVVVGKVGIGVCNAGELKSRIRSIKMDSSRSKI